ncbi:IS701 family transposase [Streptacidiphilus sp. EB129]|uniref:IS701 family transposase n=1 Tax=Streptacidiphilus sp. EB129 TaxID=3156262 RepID=UPI0035188E54
MRTSLPGRATVAGTHRLNRRLDEVCGSLLASLSRRDQRETGARYVQGLVSLDGRKTMRAIAELFGGGAVQQRMQHFISNSSWDWMPVRAALAELATEVLDPEALVVRPMLVPKSGTHSVGVERRYVQGLGQTMSGQQAVGAWLAADTAAAPVNWKLALPESWLADEERRRRAGIPDGCGERFPGDLATHAALELAVGGVDGAPLPVVLAAAGLDLAACLDRFAEAAVPVLLPIGGAERVLVTAQDLPGRSNRELSARHLAELLGTLRQPVGWYDPTHSAPRRSCALTVPVRLPSRPRRPLRLLAEWDQSGRIPDRLWLTSLPDHSAAELLRMAKLPLRVDHDVERVTKPVGIHDFEGRSFPGWHRHATLASVAHALTVLDDLDRARAVALPQAS